MGHKVNPVGFRIGVNRDWQSKWFAKRDYSSYLLEDIKIRKLLTVKLKEADLSHIDIERAKDKVEVFAHVVRTGVAIGQDGKAIEELQKSLVKMTGKQVKLSIVELKQPDLDANIIAAWMATQLENRASFRTVQKKAIQRVMKAGGKGIKTMVSGRLAGADIARKEGYSEGVVPLHTLRADIDFAVAEAHTTYGRLGVKVWICRGDILPAKKNVTPTTPEAKGE